MPIRPKSNKKVKLARYSDKERRFVLPKRTTYDANFLPIIQNLNALGFPAADIGMILGYAGKDARQFIKNLRKSHPDVGDAIDIGLKMANSFLVGQMYKSAVGYDYDEVEQEYEVTHNADGTVKSKILVKEKNKDKHYSGSPQLAMFLAANRMPESFVNRLEIHKRGFSFNPFDDVPKDAIRKLAGKLLEYADGRKKVKSKEVKETEK